MIRLAALGAVGYLGYRYLQKMRSDARAADADVRARAVAGGPLSSQATLQHTADAPPG